MIFGLLPQFRNIYFEILYVIIVKMHLFNIFLCFAKMNFAPFN